MASRGLIEVHDEWQISDSRYSEGSMALIDAEPADSPPPLEITQEVAMAELIAS